MAATYVNLLIIPPVPASTQCHFLIHISGLQINSAELKSLLGPGNWAWWIGAIWMAMEGSLL